MRHLLILVLSLVAAILGGAVVRHAIVAELVPWRVSDIDGHGPDYGGKEWRGALEAQAKRFSKKVGGLFFIFAVALSYIRQRTFSRFMDYKAACPKCGKKLSRWYIFCEPTIYHQCRECGTAFRPTLAANLSAIGFILLNIVLYVLVRRDILSVPLALALIAFATPLIIWIFLYITSERSNTKINR